MNKLLSVARVLIGVFLAVGMTNAHAGQVRVIFDNQLSNPVQRTVQEGPWAPPSELQQFTMDEATTDLTLSGYRKVAYADPLAGQACLFQLYGYWDATTGYSIFAGSTPLGVEGGPYISCSHSVDYSSYPPVVTFTLWGY